jgi:hypothetical protein
MAEPELETVLEKRFANIEKRREDLLARRAELDEQLHDVEDEYQRVKTAQEALAGKFRVTPTERRPRAASGRRAPRGARAELREKIVNLIKGDSDGLTAEGINSALEAHDKKAKQQIANVLSSMKADGVLTQEARRGPYKLA